MMHTRSVLLLMLGLAHPLLAQLQHGQLGARVAVTFGRFGRPVQWVPREDFFSFALLWGACVALLPLAIALLIQRVPAVLFSIPRREYWLSPDRVGTLRRVLSQWMLGVGLLTAGFSLGVFWLTLSANSRRPIVLPNVFFLLLAFFLVALLCALLLLLARLSRDEQS